MLDDSENMDNAIGGQPASGRVPNDPTQNLDLLPPIDPAPIPSSDNGQPPADILNNGETDAFQGALDEFYYNPSSIAIDPYNWFSSSWIASDIGQQQIWTC